MFICCCCLFSFDYTGIAEKLTGAFRFPSILDMAPYVKELQPGSQRLYELSAVLLHQGNTANSGHYTAQIRNPEVSGPGQLIKRPVADAALLA